MLPVKFGVSLPVFSQAGSKPTPGLAIEFARKAEALGFDSLWTFDVPFLRVSGQFLDPLVTLAAVAPETERVSLGTSVIILPLRNPLILAKTVATLDVLSEGRVILGIGAGFFKSDFDILQLPYERRFEAAEESIKVLKKLWSGKKMSFSGKFFKFKNVSIEPGPSQKPHPPIWIEGRNVESFKLVASIGNGWIAPGFITSKEIKRGREMISRVTRSKGLRMNKRQIVIANAVHTHISSSTTEALQACEPFFRELYKGRVPENLKETSLLGTTSECIDNIRERLRAGVNHFILILPSNDLRQMELLAREILPAVRE